MAHVVDKGLITLRDQVDELAPQRSKASDGTLGDPAHAAGTSDHNPEDTEDSSDGNDPDNQVDAIDITHDPAHGCDIGALWEQIRLSRDPRVLYAIYNRRIFSSYATSTRKAWEWGPYNGDNPHDKHGHLSVNDTHNDDTRKWKIMSNIWDEKAGGTNSVTRTFRQILQDLSNWRNVMFSEPDALLNGNPYYGRGTVIDLLVKFLTRPDPAAAINVKLDLIADRLTDIEYRLTNQADNEQLAQRIAELVNVDNLAAEIVTEIKDWYNRP